VKQFGELSEREILALAITMEEQDARIYRDYADGLSESFPASAQVFLGMAAEEDEHRRWLIELYRERFGEHIPLIRTEDVRGLMRHKPLWLVRPLGLDAVRQQAETIEQEARRFYERAQSRATHAATRKLLGDLAAAEQGHVAAADKLGEKHLTRTARDEEEATRQRMFVLQIIQPGLVGLMDGSVSTLAPLFAAAFATHSSWETFLVGLAASVGAGVSMGFAEALSDDGSLTGRGTPWIRGAITGLMTAIGGIGHTIPYLIDNFQVATSIAILVVMVELWVIAWIRARYMDTPFLRAAFEVVLGGLIVFAAGVLIGNA
jgi:erythrin-vacuolar iron transport family protein